MATAYSGNHDLGQMICEALGVKAEETMRIVIDIDASDPGPIRVYVEMIATDRMLEVDWMAGLGGADITILDKE
jgi:hypothetical protein